MSKNVYLIIMGYIPSTIQFIEKSYEHIYNDNDHSLFRLRINGYFYGKCLFFIIVFLRKN